MFNQYQPVFPQPIFPMRWWEGASRQRYLFRVFRIDDFYDFDGVVYILTRSRPDGFFDPLYIGQSSEGGVRLSRHEKMPSARMLGASHVHVHFVENRAARFATETDLRRQYYTPLNEQPTPAPVAGLGSLVSSLLRSQLNAAPTLPPVNLSGAGTDTVTNLLLALSVAARR